VGKERKYGVDAGKDKTFIQCLSCGYIHILERKIPISVSVEKCECPRCKYPTGLNCGNKEEDIYTFYDPGLDERYFNY
jgi:hypothetical protein